MMNYLRVFLVLVLLGAATGTFAQRTADIGLSTGVVNYVGDLGNEQYFPFSSAAPGVALTLRNFLNNPKHSGTRYRTFDLQARFSWHRLQYDETKPLDGQQGTELRNYLRGISFRNDLFGIETDVTYNIYLNRFMPLWKPKISIFFTAGIGAFYGAPKADLFNGDIQYQNRYYFWADGTVRNQPENSKNAGEVIKRDGEYETNLKDWMTEGQGFNNEAHAKKPYSNFNIGIPFGGGIRYIYNKYLSFAAEFNYYYFLTDYLDDVSSRYATYEELRASFPTSAQYELAKYISDPSGHGTNGSISSQTSVRGNPGKNDSYTYFSIEASYKFTWKKKGIYGQ